MNEKIIKTVEFNKIIEMLSEKANSDPGRKLCKELLPMNDIEDINKAQEQTEAALSFLFRNGNISFGSNRDFNTTFKSLAIGKTLPPSELLHIASFLENTARVRALCPEDRTNPLFDLFDCLYPLTQISSQIRRCIVAEDIIADDASSELKRIRREITLTEDRIHTQLQKMVNSTYSAYLQDNVITLRDDRYCIPVKSEYKTLVKGIVHDSSSTGSTLFIEPSSIVEMNNNIRELQGAEKKEIDRILAELSALCEGELIALRDNNKNMTLLDFIFAKASLALDQNAVRPVFTNDHVIEIIKGRHPLIDKKKVVPIDLTIGRDCDMIIVTGPNTGGKTVTLKTVGLFELMGMSGLHIPAGDRSVLSVFREVFADIGDEQSIEQNLSTFSSHMTSIVDILGRADKNCLCLFDELGSGTDPTEGAALAISILNFMHTRKITTLATTHYSELKLFAMQTEGIVNASCEFDVDTLMPTYKLLVGVPGKSNAFAIATKLGMPGYIIETAKEQLTKESKDFEDVLSQLETTRLRAEKEKEEADRLRASLALREQQLKQREASFEEKRKKILDDANKKARDILQDAKDQADHAISEIRKSGKGFDMAEMERTRSALREKVTAKNNRLAAKPAERTSQKLRAEDIHIGDSVKIISMGLTGVVAALPDSKQRVQVRCGIIHSLVGLDDLAKLEEASAAPSIGKKSGKSGKGSSMRRAFSDPNSGSESGSMDFSRAMGIKPEINLLGMTTDEAIMALDKYLDDARMSHLDTVRVVHGKGTGALRNAVQNYLRRQKWIKSYRNGDFGEGDAGVTIVTL